MLVTCSGNYKWLYSLSPTNVIPYMDLPGDLYNKQAIPTYLPLSENSITDVTWKKAAEKSRYLIN